MSNSEYKEWVEKRREEAWYDIHKIAELVCEWEENGASASEISECFSEIKQILKDNWI